MPKQSDLITIYNKDGASTRTTRRAFELVWKDRDWSDEAPADVPGVVAAADETPETASDPVTPGKGGKPDPAGKNKES